MFTLCSRKRLRCRLDLAVLPRYPQARTDPQPKPGSALTAHVHSDQRLRLVPALARVRDPPSPDRANQSAEQPHAALAHTPRQKRNTSFSGLASAAHRKRPRRCRAAALRFPFRKRRAEVCAAAPRSAPPRPRALRGPASRGSSPRARAAAPLLGLRRVGRDRPVGGASLSLSGPERWRGPAAEGPPGRRGGGAWASASWSRRAAAWACARRSGYRSGSCSVRCPRPRQVASALSPRRSRRLAALPSAGPAMRPLVSKA